MYKIQCTFLTQYIADVTDASDSQNRTTNKGFLDSYQEFPAYPDESGSPSEVESDNVDVTHVSDVDVTHVSETPPGSPSPHTNQVLNSQIETAGTYILN